MSSFRTIKITCPDCNTEGSYTVWDSVNVDLDPELKSKVMDGSLFTWACSNCKKSFNAPYSFLYHDMTHNFMVQFDASRNHIIPFAEYLRVLENELDMNVIAAIAADFRENHPQMNILFDGLAGDKTLVFTILKMPERTWEFTEKKHMVSYEDYINACKITKTDEEEEEKE